MLNRNWLAMAAAAFLALGLSTGCSVDEDDCTSNADCAEDEICSGLTEEVTEGTCEKVEAATCGEGAACSNNFACNTETSTCHTTCTTDAECVSGFTCSDTNACVADATATVTYPYVAIISETTNAEDLENNTPGPDIDAIELISGGTSYFAAQVPASFQGAADENANNDVNAITGPLDAIPSSGTDCDLAEVPNAKFWSMGDNTGFAVVTFSQNVADGDMIRVWELDDLLCDIGPRSDQYAVSVGNNAVDLATISTASSVSGNNWTHQGSSNGGGGKIEFTFAAP